MIVIPMAGMSSRFFKAGYKKPKYMLEAHGKTLFDHSINSFKKYFETELFLFIVRDVYDSPAFVEKRARAIGIRNFKITILNEETRGQAETVTVGIESIPDYKGPISIFNIDTFRPGFIFPNVGDLGDGYLEVFKGEGSNWSFVKPLHENTTQIIQATEKNPVSNLCCTGLYYFRDVNEYLKAYYTYLSLPEDSWEKGELYVAPIYNILIADKKEIHYNLININDVIFCGVPDEYNKFLDNDIGK